MNTAVMRSKRTWTLTLATATWSMAMAVALGACESSRPASKGIEPSAEAPTPAIDRIARASALAEQANQAQSAGKIDDAIRLNKEALSQYEEFSAPWNNLGVLYMDRDQNLEAANAFQRAAELSPNDPRFPYNIGVIWWRLGYGEDAAKQFNKALECDPNYLPALRYSIQWDVRRGQPSEDTAARLRRALLVERDPQSRDWLLRQQLLVTETLNKRPPVGTPPVHSPVASPVPAAQVAPPRP